MGRRGPKAQPTARKKLTGNPGKRKLSDDVNPDSLNSVPIPPDFLDEVGKSEWRTVAPQLLQLGLLTGVDLTALAAYCSCYSRWIAAEKVILNEGMIMTIYTEKGGKYSQARPEVAISRSCLQEMRKFASLFGMSPADRSGLVVKTGKKKSALSEFNGSRPNAAGHPQQ